LKKLNAQICIIPVISATCPVSLRHLSPSHSNIRISEDRESATSYATPIYNNAILIHKSPRYHLLATHNLKNSAASFGDALALLRVWANQRGFGEGTRLCVRGFEGKGSFWASVLSVVVYGENTVWMRGAKSNKARKALGRGLSSYQLFRAALDFLGVFTCFQK
jgi:U3 small nucleolar RNA-associated protein 22